MSESIFTKIVKGEIPCHKVYEDDNTLAFLDIHPAAEGHTLVIPKKQVEFVWDLSPDDYAALMETTQKVAQHLRTVIGKKYVGSKVVGTDVPHAHVHLIPFNTVPEMKGATGTDRAKQAPNHEALAALAARLEF